MMVGKRPVPGETFRPYHRGQSGIQHDLGLNTQQPHREKKAPGSLRYAGGGDRLSHRGLHEKNRKDKAGRIATEIC